MLLCARTRLCDRQQKHKWILKRSNQFEFTEIAVNVSAEIRQKKITLAFHDFIYRTFINVSRGLKFDWVLLTAVYIRIRNRVQKRHLGELHVNHWNREFDEKLFDLQWKFFASLTAFDRRRLILNRIGMMKREFALKVCKSFRKQRFGRRRG